MRTDPRDAVGAATLERLAGARNYNRWLTDRLQPWIGRRVLEIGAGLGSMSEFILDRERVVLSDTDPYYLARLRERFGTRPNVRIAELRLPDGDGALAAERLDTLLCPNVLEHVYFNLAGVPGWWLTGRVLKRRIIPAGSLDLYDALVPLFRLERFLPWRVGQSLIAIGERVT